MLIYSVTSATDMTETLRTHIEAFDGSPGDTYLLVSYDDTGPKWQLSCNEIIARQDCTICLPHR